MNDKELFVFIGPSKQQLLNKGEGRCGTMLPSSHSELNIVKHGFVSFCLTIDGIIWMRLDCSLTTLLQRWTLISTVRLGKDEVAWLCICEWNFGKWYQLNLTEWSPHGLLTL